MTEDFLILVKSGWPQVVAIFCIIWWCRKIDMKSEEYSGRLDRHEARLTSLEANQHTQALQMARIEEALSGIKNTLDRIYARIDDK